MSSLKSLSLDYNELNVLPDWLGGLTTLTSLDVSGNALLGLPENLGLAGLGESLLTLTAASNALLSLPFSFSRLSFHHSLLLIQASTSCACSVRSSSLCVKAGSAARITG
eukprot:scaffold263956_cov15-Tisochrysis_lutea.AAC.1